MTTLNQEKYVVNLKYQEEHFTPGHTVEKSNPSKPKEDNIDTTRKIYLPSRKTPLNKTTVTVEYPPEDNSVTSSDKLSSSNLRTTGCTSFAVLFSMTS